MSNLSCFILCVWMCLCLLLQGSLVVSSGDERPCRHLEAAIRLPDDHGVYFFSSGRYMQYDEYSEVEKSVGTVGRLGLANLTSIDAVFAVPGVQNLVIVASGPEFYRYNTTRGNFRSFVGHGNLRNDLGIPPDLDAGFETPHKMTVMKGCELWTFDVRNSRGFVLEQRSLMDMGIPCNLDSALTWYEGGPVTLIKGHQMWKLYRFDDDDGEGMDEVEGPFHTDDLNICSWYLCGEADFNPPPNNENMTACNGDPRLCPLRLDQVTLPGLHNAGAGFAHGFGLLNCWLKNHGRSIYDQLKLGIRHLDIDPCYDTCGYLGTCHSFRCGGSICSMIKQMRRFLLEHPYEVVTVNFNHEIVEPRKVFRDLTRQLQAQLGPLLNSAFRETSEWPTLRDAIGQNKRLFVIYAYIIQNEPHAFHYRNRKWIHTEHWYGSTWREIELTSGCSGLVTTTENMCYHRQYRELVEVSSVVTPSFFECIDHIADTCRPRLMETLRVCEGYRYRHGKSPNVLLVDYPEVSSEEVTSVFNAVYHQNVRNILQHRPQECRLAVDAAVTVNNKGLIFSGTKAVVHDFDSEMQIDIKDLPEELHNIDAVYTDPFLNRIYAVKECSTWQIDPTSLSYLTQIRTMDACLQYNLTDIDAAVGWNGMVHIFKGCYVFIIDPSNLDNTNNHQLEIADMGLPCDIDAVMTSQDGGSLYVFKDNLYWSYAGDGLAGSARRLREWNIDVLRCSV